MDHNHIHDDRISDQYLGNINIDKAVPSCDDQLPSIARVGRGLHGNDYRVDVVDNRPVDPLLNGWKDQSGAETYLQGSHYDHATKEWTTDWVSENVSGGQLFYQYNLRPFTEPKTFTITFIYRRPENPLLPGETPGQDPDEWSWTTPAIPYFVSDNTGGLDDNIGSGVANSWVREGADKDWKEVLTFPEGTTAADFNAPDPLEPWSTSITFGVGGDVEIPNLDDIAKIVGVSVDVIRNIINNVAGALDGSDNLKDYIDTQDTDILGHIHTDMGWGGPGAGGDLIGDTPASVIPAETLPLPIPAAGQPYTIKNYIDYKLGLLQQAQDDLKQYIDNALGDILDKINGGGTLDPDTGHITWPDIYKIPTGSINIYSGGTTSPTGIFSHPNPATAMDLDFE